MKIFKSKFSEIPVTKFREIYPLAMIHFQKLKNKSRRKPFIRSKFFMSVFPKK